MKNLGENLIFLISLPRSGSTLLQHILAGHSIVAATAEPWILFPSALALRPQALSADYNASIGQIALSEFLTQIDDGEEQYYTAVRKMCLDLYNAFLMKHDKKRFLDKTSRYYLILPELFRIFPRAQYIFLIRNPLAVFASFLESMVFQNLKRLGEPGIRDDLLDGYRLMRQGIRYFGDNAIVVKYEDLVTDSEATARQLCKTIGLEFEPDMLHYGKMGVLPGKLVDPKSIHKHQTPVEDYVDAWKAKFTTRQERHLAQGFLAHLGPELINSLGYSYEELVVGLPKEDRGWAPLMRWDVLMTPPAQRSRLQRLELNIAYVLQMQGLAQTLKCMGKRVLETACKFSRVVWNVFWKRARNLRIMQPVRQWVHIIRRYGNPYHGSDGNTVSSEHKVVDLSQLPSELLRGWRAPSVAERQHAAYLPLLKKMYEGNPRQDFVVAAQALRLTSLPNPTVLEIGCGNGYYSEVLSHLTHRQIKYAGLDYSQAMIESAHKHYPDRQLIMGDATALPFVENAFDIAWSGTVLMHLVDYKKAISETYRVARHFCIFHSTPVLADGPTTFLRKKAYGGSVAEVIISQVEFENLLREHGLVIRHVLESLPYNAGSVVTGTVHTLSYVCDKGSVT